MRTARRNAAGASTCSTESNWPANEAAAPSSPTPSCAPPSWRRPAARRRPDRGPPRPRPAAAAHHLRAGGLRDLPAPGRVARVEPSAEDLQAVAEPVGGEEPAEGLGGQDVTRRHGEPEPHQLRQVPRLAARLPRVEGLSEGDRQCRSRGPRRRRCNAAGLDHRRPRHAASLSYGGKRDQPGPIAHRQRPPSCRPRFHPEKEQGGAERRVHERAREQDEEADPHETGTTDASASSMPALESNRSATRKTARRRRPAAASPGGMPSRRLTNELGSSPPMKPRAAQAPTRPYRAGVSGQSPRAGGSGPAVGQRGEQHEGDAGGGHHHQEAAQGLVRAEDRPAAEGAAAVEGNREAPRERRGQPHCVRGAGQREGRHQEQAARHRIEGCRGHRSNPVWLRFREQEQLAGDRARRRHPLRPSTSLATGWRTSRSRYPGTAGYR